MGKNVQKSKNNTESRKPKTRGKSKDATLPKVGNLVVPNGGKKGMKQKGKGGVPEFEPFRYNMKELRKLVESRLTTMKPDPKKRRLVMEVEPLPQVATLVGQLRARGLDVRQEEVVIETSEGNVRVHGITY